MNQIKKSDRFFLHSFCSLSLRFRFDLGVLLFGEKLPTQLFREGNVSIFQSTLNKEEYRVFQNVKPEPLPFSDISPVLYQRMETFPYNFDEDPYFWHESQSCLDS